MFKYIVLGIVQGFTEFLPVSSSGHLVVIQKLWAISEPAVALDVVLHLGTLFAVAVFFFSELLKALRSLKTIALILVVTLITGSIALAGKDFFEALFSSPKAVAIGWIVTGIILLATRKFSQGKREALNIKDALALGLAQAAAVIPGISRSGATISTLLFRKIEPRTSFNFSFLVSLPAVLAAAILKSREISALAKIESQNLALAFICSFLCGLFALRMLKKVLAKARFHYFGYYCLSMAIITLLLVK
jgi:undecaprenyl-diphosphatase